MTKRENHQRKIVKRQKNASKPANDGSNESVLLADVQSLLSKHHAAVSSPRSETGEGNGDTKPARPEPHSLPEKFSEVDIKISQLSSTGDGLGFSPDSDHVYVVPFTVPGDTVKAKTITHFPQARYTLTDLVKVIKSGPQRDNSLIKCPYFAKCAGCQIQMLPYDLQLKHKKEIIEKAYLNFSALTPEVVPPVGDTIESPLQYGYRTKLTPHFDGPPGSMSRKAKRDPSLRKGFDSVPPIGFNEKGTRRIIDIEDCPIGTDAVREGLKRERKKVGEEIARFTKGATILLRESTERRWKPAQSAEAKTVSIPESHEDESPDAQEAAAISKESNTANDVARTTTQTPDSTHFTDIKSCITDQRATSTEYIDSHILLNTAGAFFQNNNFILPTFTAYIRSHILPPPSAPQPPTPPITNLIDAYCGSGLFSITLSALFTSTTGIDIAPSSIVSARQNATLNNTRNATFLAADAADLFASVTYAPEATVVVIDPPRKGCDGGFLRQLLRFGARRVVYVSCNVHTQARDVGVLVEGVGGVEGEVRGERKGEGAVGEGKGRGVCRYRIESLQGFDFFPQTGHVESVAVLARED
ncbi:tRNA(m5U54)methyltransferase [Puttea exsequens]|nr:tRNA(m5U54)methyltransferase [Puttea exsequens]